MIEAAVDHAWSYIFHKDDDINNFIEGMKEESPEFDLNVSKEELDKIGEVIAKIFVEFVALRLHWMNEGSAEN